MRKIIQKTLDGQRLPTNFDRRPTIRNKIHKNESKLLKQNLQGGKRFIAICDTIPTLSVYYKGSLNNKNGILYKANHNFNKFLKNHQSFPYKKGKSLKDMLVRAKKKRLTKGSRDVRSVTRCIFSHNRFVSILAIMPAGCVLYNKCGQLSRLVLFYVIKLGDPPPKGSCKLHDPPLAQGSKPYDPPPLCSGPPPPPPPLYFLTSPLFTCFDGDGKNGGDFHTFGLPNP